MGFSDWLARRKGYVKPDEVQPPSKRGFEAAKVNRLVAAWTTTPKPIDTDIHAGLRKLRARSRDLALNNDYVRRFLTLAKSNVIGHKGVILQAKSMDPSGQLDALANNAIEEAWREFWAYGVPDVTGTRSGVDVLRLYVETLVKDGEVLLVKHFNWPHNRFKFALEWVDVEALDVELNMELSSGNVIRMGVELDQWRRPAAYHLLTTSSTASDYTYQGRKYRRIPAERVIHRFLSESAWQTRGFPLIASAMMRLNMLQGYEEAELVAARVSSAKMGFFETEGDASYVGEGTDADGNPIMEAEPGVFEQLPVGVKFNPFDPQHPTTAYDSFVKGILRGIAAGLGVSYFSLANDLEGVNYSSGRLGVLEDREIWKALQEWVITSFCQPVFEEWLKMSLLAGAINVAGRPLKSSRIDKYRRVSWQPRRWEWTDPQKEMNSYATAVENRFMSISQVIRERGHDPDEVFDEIAADMQKLKERNIEPADAGFSLSSQSGEPDESEKE